MVDMREALNFEAALGRVCNVLGISMVRFQDANLLGTSVVFWIIRCIIWPSHRWYTPQICVILLSAYIQ
jgi:hypothetical protein